jgi:hypothetical protein
MRAMARITRVSAADADGPVFRETSSRSREKGCADAWDIPGEALFNERIGLRKGDSCHDSPLRANRASAIRP